MKFGDKTTLAITGVDKKGRGCGHVNVPGNPQGSRTACVPFCVPGEEVEATLVRRDKGDFIMKLDRVVKESPRRVVPRCIYAGKCGGCAWQQFDYALQLEMKRNLVNAAFAAHGVPAIIEAVVPAPAQYYYRNRMDYCVGPRGEIGLKEPGRWNAYLDLRTCYLLSPDAVKVMEIVRDWMKEFAVAPWDNVNYVGYLRYVVIREGKNTGKRLVTLITAAGSLPQKDALLERLRPLATTIYHGINDTQTDVSITPDMTLLHGDAELEEEVLGKRFLIPPNSFFQTNSTMAAKLVETVGDFLTGDNPHSGTVPLLLDLYCGVGFFGISLAHRAERIIGVELDEAAAAVASRNAERNGVTNATFTTAKAESLAWADERADAVIVDPPRAGLHPKVIGSLLAHAPKKIVYVSCNYESFARDWKSLSEKYALERIACLDLFPHSPHVETVGLLTRLE